MDAQAYAAMSWDHERMPTAGRSGSQPDFASIYGGDDILTPRLAAHLWGAAVFLSDTHREDPHSPVLRQELPPVVQRLADESWIERFVSCFETLAERLGTGRFIPEHLASCTAEEMALHMVIDLAEDFVADGIVPGESELPRRGDEDTDFDFAREILFRDHDVLMLFNRSLDGIEDDSSELADQYRFANLHPRDWFEPFADVIDP